MAINETEFWTPDELAAAVQLSDEVLVKSGEAPIDRDQAQAIVEERLLAYAGNRRTTWLPEFLRTPGPQDNTTRALAQLIVSALPPDALDDGVIRSVDLRPFLSTVGRFPSKRFRFRRPMAPDVDVTLADSVEPYLTAINETATESIRSRMAQASVPVDQRDAFVEVELRYEEARAGLDPSSRFEQTTTGEEGAPQAGWEGVSGGIFEDSTDVPIFNLGEQEAWRAVAGEEQSWIDEVPAENLRITMETAQDRGGSRLKMMSLTQARQYLDQLTDNQYRDWQRKMYQAGYYDKVGAGFVEGDRFDRATDQAWQLLLLESFKGNQPIMNQLATSYETRKQRLNQRWMETMRNEFLPMADAISLDVIGRRLRPDEYESVRNYIGSLQRTRIQQTRGELMTEDQTGFGFDERDLRRGLEYATGGTISEITPGELEAAERVRRYWENKED